MPHPRDRCTEDGWLHSPERPARIAPSQVGGERTDIQHRHSRVVHTGQLQLFSAAEQAGTVTSPRLVGARVEMLMEGMVTQALQELTAMYSASSF